MFHRGTRRILAGDQRPTENPNGAHPSLGEQRFDLRLEIVRLARAVAAVNEAHDALAIEDERLRHGVDGVAAADLLVLVPEDRELDARADEEGRHRVLL